ncbi:MAG: hypothetical protein ABIO74_12530 [Dokdonella sp.]
MRLPALFRCRLTPLVAAGLICTAAGADTPDLVAHHGFEVCWSAALTVDGFAATLNSAVEGYSTCIAPTGGSTPQCNDSICNGAPGCPMTLRSGSVVPAYFDPQNGAARFDASGGIDPLVIDLVVMGAHCVVTINDTSTVVSQSQIHVPIVSDGNFGWYTVSPLIASNTTVSGLRSTDYAVSGDFVCYAGGSFISPSTIQGQLASAIEDAWSEAERVAIGETICPYPPQ